MSILPLIDRAEVAGCSFHQGFSWVKLWCIIQQLLGLGYAHSAGQITKFQYSILHSLQIKRNRPISKNYIVIITFSLKLYKRKLFAKLQGKSETLKSWVLKQIHKFEIFFVNPLLLGNKHWCHVTQYPLASFLFYVYMKSSVVHYLFY